MYEGMEEELVGFCDAVETSEEEEEGRWETDSLRMKEAAINMYSENSFAWQLKPGGES